jgi:hypothetical protein
MHARYIPKSEQDRNCTHVFRTDRDSDDDLEWQIFLCLDPPDLDILVDCALEWYVGRRIVVDVEQITQCRVTETGTMLVTKFSRFVVHRIGGTHT